MVETEVLDPVGSGPPGGLGMPLRLKLSVMMLLQYALWGAWWVVLGKYMTQIGFTDANIGRVYATTAVASIFSPIIFGQIADRWIPTQYLLSFLHLAGAGMLFLATRVTYFGSFYMCVLIWALLYIPTISLTNSLSFHHIPDAAKHFPGIRVFGTIGWIVAGWIVYIAGLEENSIEPILLAGGLSAALGLYCLILPHTPAIGRPGEALAFVRAFKLLKKPDFALFMAMSFLIAIALAAYFAFGAIFLEDLGKAKNVEAMKNAAPLLTIGQFAEMLLLPFLPFFLKHLGMKWTLVLGMGAWAARYAVFSLGDPSWLVIGSLALHGVCYDFFFVAGYIHTDNQANDEIRASAQALFNLVVMGLGMLIGNELFGQLVNHYRVDKVVAWPTVWAYPAIGAAIAMLIFIVAFRENQRPTTAEA